MKNVNKKKMSNDPSKQFGNMQTLSEQNLMTVVGGDVRRNTVNVGFQHLFKKKKKK